MLCPYCGKKSRFSVRFGDRFDSVEEAKSDVVIDDQCRVWHTDCCREALARLRTIDHAPLDVTLGESNVSDTRQPASSISTK